MKTTLQTLLVLAVISTGLVWATDQGVDVPQPVPETAQPQHVEPAEETGDGNLDDLLEADPNTVEAGACCVADCYAEKEACLDDCGGGPQCISACSAALQACKRSC